MDDKPRVAPDIHVGLGINAKLHIVAVLEPVTVQTGDDDVAITHKPGLYTFTSYKAARAFNASLADGFTEEKTTHFFPVPGTSLD